MGLGAGLPFGQLLIKDHVEGRGRYRAPHRVPSERAPVLAGLDDQQDIAVGEDHADGEHTAGDGFSQDLQERKAGCVRVLGWAQDLMPRASG